MTKKYMLYVRKQIEVNTDPLRRCYNGCHFSSEIIWTEWEEVYSSPALESVEESVKTYQSINPRREYKIVSDEERG